MRSSHKKTASSGATPSSGALKLADLRQSIFSRLSQNSQNASQAKLSSRLGFHEREKSEAKKKRGLRINTNSLSSQRALGSLDLTPSLPLTEFSKKHMKKVTDELFEMGKLEAQKLEFSYDPNPIVLKEPDNSDARLKLWKRFEKPVILEEGTKQVVKASSKSILLLRVNSLNKVLPAMVEISKAEPDTEFYVAFNRNPSSMRFDLKAQGNRVLIPEKFSGEMTDPYSIRVMVLLHHCIVSEVFVAFVHPKPKVIVNPEIDKYRYYNYSEYFKICLQKSSRPRTRRQGQSPTHLARSVASGLSLTKLQPDGKAESRRLQERILEAQKKKVECHEKKQELLHQDQDKFIKLKRRNELIMNLIVDRAVQLGTKNAWARFLLFYRTIDEVRGRFIMKKMVYMMESKKLSRIRAFQKTWRKANNEKREAAMALDPIAGSADLVIAKKALLLLLNHQKARARRRACMFVGFFLSRVFKAVSLNNKIFQYTSQYTVMKNKFRRHMRTKRELLGKFSNEFKQVMRDLILTEGIFGKNYLQVNQALISDENKAEMFDYIFNFYLLGFLQSRMKKIRKCDPVTADQLIVTQEQKASIQRIPQLYPMKGIAVYLQKHKLRYLFERVEENIRTGKYESSSEFGADSRINSRAPIVRQSSLKDKSLGSGYFRDKAQEEAERERLLSMIEQKNLKPMFDSFIASYSQVKLTISYPRSFFVSLIYTTLDILYARDTISTTSLQLIA